MTLSLATVLLESIFTLNKKHQSADIKSWNNFAGNFWTANANLPNVRILSFILALLHECICSLYNICYVL